MRSEAGLARTARQFDIWNPSRGSATEITATAARIDAMRTADQAPIEVYQRVFLEPSVPDPKRPPSGVDGVTAEVDAARAAGFASVIVEANFWREIRSSDDWISLPGKLAGALKLV